MLSSSNPKKLYQFAWNGSSYEYGHNSIPEMSITGAPADTDYSKWAMLHDGNNYRLYFAKNGIIDKLYQFAWNGATYKYGFNSIPTLSLDSIPRKSHFNIFNMLHDGSDYRFYFLAP